MAANIDIFVNVVDAASAVLQNINNQIQSMTRTLGQMNQVARTNFSVFTGGFKSITEAVQNTHFTNINAELKQLGSVGTKSVKDFGAAVQRATNKALKQMDTQVKNVAKSTMGMGSSFRRAQQILLGLGLSLLFTGMALKRIADSALRSLFNTMSVVSGETGEFNVLTNELTANWEFLKFTMVDALMQSGLFSVIIGAIISVIQWLAQLPPAVKKWVVIFLVGAAAIGAVMMVVGQTLLFFIAILILVAMFGGSVILLFLLGWAAIIAILYVLFRVWNSGMSESKKIIFTLILAVAALAVALYVLASPVLYVILVIIILVGFFFYMRDKWDNVWTNMKLVALNIVYQIARAFEGLVNTVIRGLNYIIRGANKIPGVDIGQISEVDFTSGILGTMVDLVQAQEAKDAKDSGTTINQENVFNINQQPGEDTEALSSRIIDDMNERVLRNLGSPKLG